MIIAVWGKRGEKSMPEYIDRLELLRAIGKEGAYRARKSETGLTQGLILAMQIAKKKVNPADVIPVVRCSECEHSEPYSDSQSALTCREFGCTVPKDGFCHEGRRKNNGNQDN